MKILDQYGKPIKKQSLGKELARPSLTGVRQVWGSASVSNGLTPERLATIFQQAENGDHQAYLSLAEEMEERDAHYGSVLRTRKLAISGLELIVESASDESKDLDLAQAIREQVKRPCFQEDCLDDLLDALGKGFSVVEMVWQRGEFWQPDFIWRDPHWFTWDREAGAELRLLDENNLVDGIALEPHRFITHKPKIKSGLTVRSGLARMAAIAYMCKTWTLKDWMAFADVFGLPLRVGKFGRGATDDEIDTLITAISNIASDAGAVIPESMAIDFVESSKGAGGGAGMFKELAEYLDSQLSKAVLGQTMTADNGSSQAQAKVHNEVRIDILKADAKRLSNTLNRDFVKSFIDLNYGEQAHYPQICVYVPDNEDLELLASTLEKLVPLGLEVEQSVIRDKFGLPDPEQDSKGDFVGKLLGVQTATAPNHAKAFNMRQAQVPDAMDLLENEVLEDWEQVLEPVINPIETLVNKAESYQEFLDSLPKLLETMQPNELIESLALATFKARGLGDGAK
ncbi:MAG: DUF935 domain-containing protein [Methylococcales bacterium]|nr:DUF935 domain-containing protein [Methylococcales bacterium]